MVRLRLARHGAKKRPFYRIVAADKEARRDGRFLEIIGTYNPLVSWDDPKRVQLKEERIRYWLGVGAQPSDTLRSILKRKGLLDPAAAPAPAGGAAETGAEG